MLASAVEGAAYAEHATMGLSRIEQDTLFLQHVHAALVEHCTEQAGRLTDRS
ncbi:hypothetical protein [Streptomyces sp. NPDC020597]|uniref:hypothetical protein n=1 Tax=unclassified Streptomyces TaxID=2593676 RepID=UPI0037B1BD48